MTEISAKKISGYLPETYENLSVTVYETVDSTNRAAKELAANGAKLPLLVAANSQTAGRGRLGRSFYSPASTGIYMSLALGGFPSLSDAVFVTPATAVAVTDAILALTGKSARIKWVNDILLDGKKICGVLAESQQICDGFAVIVGVGLNITTDTFPDEISEIAGSLFTDVPREKMIAQITKNLLDIFKIPGDTSFMKRYKERSVAIGREIDYYMNGTKNTGTAIDIDSRGGLVVRDKSGKTVTLTGGEITVRLK